VEILSWWGHEDISIVIKKGSISHTLHELNPSGELEIMTGTLILTVRLKAQQHNNFVITVWLVQHND
jgi:hypothetical protein